MAVYLYDNIKAQIAINNSPVLSKKKKVLNSFLVWIIPLFWFYIIKDFLQPDELVITKKIRERRKKDRNESDFYEGGHGGTI